MTEGWAYDDQAAAAGELGRPDLTGAPCQEIASAELAAPADGEGSPAPLQGVSIRPDACDHLDDLGGLDAVPAGDDQAGQDHPAGEPSPGG
jgi:hypothetical protein